MKYRSQIFLLTYLDRSNSRNDCEMMSAIDFIISFLLLPAVARRNALQWGKVTALGLTTALVAHIIVGWIPPRPLSASIYSSFLKNALWSLKPSQIEQKEATQKKRTGTTWFQSNINPRLIWGREKATRYKLCSVLVTLWFLAVILQECTGGFFKVVLIALLLVLPVRISAYEVLGAKRDQLVNWFPD